MRKYQISAIVASATLAVGMVSCGDKDSSSALSTRVSRIMKYVDDEKYDEAVSYFNDHDLKEKDLTQLQDEFKKRIDTALEEYGTGNGDYDSAHKVISCAQRMNIPDMIEPLAEYSTQLSNLYNSKDGFRYGKENYESGEYLYAIQQLSKVVEQDKENYDSAQTMLSDSLTKFKSSLEEKVKEYTDNDNYDAALSYLNNCKYSAGENEEALKVINQMIADIGVDSVLSQAKALLDEGDLNGALDAVKKFEDDYDVTDSRLDDFKDSAKKDYLDNVLKKATDLADQKNYIAALNMVKNAKNVVSDSRLDTLEKRILDEKPTYLYDITLTNSTRFETVDTGDALKDTLGNTYAVGNLFTLSSASGWSSEIGSAEYNLGYKYDHLTGTISVKEDSDEATGVLKIIGDDKTLYSLNLQRALTPTSFDVDVSSVNWLKITIEDPQNGNIIAILSDWQFGVGNSEPETTTTTGEGGDTTTETTTETTAG